MSFHIGPRNLHLRVLLPAPEIFRPTARKGLKGVAELHTLTHRALTTENYPLSLTKEYSELESRSLEGLKDLKFDHTDFPSQICDRETELSRARNGGQIGLRPMYRKLFSHSAAVPNLQLVDMEQKPLPKEKQTSEADEHNSQVPGAVLAWPLGEEWAKAQAEKAQRPGKQGQDERNKLSGDSHGAQSLGNKRKAGNGPRAKPRVSFDGHEFIPRHDTDHTDSDSDPGGNETATEGAGNRPSSLPLSDEYPERLSSSPSIDGDDDIDFEFVYALHNFIATVRNQVSVVKGETMVLLDDSNSYWWLVRLVKDGTLGYLPAEYIETPTGRLSRLNKHRNIDLAATMLGDVPGAR